jgi:nitrogen fixation NifU-like protein
VEDGRIQKARFKGEGCSISLASAFIMTDAIKGKELNETLRMAEQFSQMMQGEMVEF